MVVGFQVTGGAGESGLLSNPEISRTPAIPSPRGADLAEWPRVSRKHSLWLRCGGLSAHCRFAVTSG